MRNFLLAVALFLGIYFVISNFSELKEVQRVLAQVREKGDFNKPDKIAIDVDPVALL